MAKILIYNNYSNRMEKFERELSQAMPYNSNKTLTVKEFRGSSISNILWSSVIAMESWNSFRYLYGKPIYVGFAFKRPWEGGHSLLSQHYSGLAFDIGQNLSEDKRDYMRDLAEYSNVWNYVEPKDLTPRWVHVDDRLIFSGYPLVKIGTKGTYVCVLQDGLNALGYNTGGLDGIFGSITLNAVRNFQLQNELNVDGIVGNNTWRVLMNKVVGIGENKYVEN